MATIVISKNIIYYRIYINVLYIVYIHLALKLYVTKNVYL